MRGSHTKRRFTRRRAVSALAATCLALALLLWATAGAGSQAPDGEQETEKRPNLVVLMTDDQTVRDLRGMRHTRRLVAGRGVSFTRSFVSYPLCCPSRATYLSGQYPHNHRVRGLTPPTGGYGRFDKANSLPVWLARAGYRSAHIGKFLNGYGSDTPDDVPPGWSEWYGAVDPSTYRMWGYTLNENGEHRTYGSPLDRDPRNYQTDVFNRKALDFIERRADQPEPFFLSVGYVAPHHERSALQQQTGHVVRPAPRHAGLRSTTRLPRPRSFDEPDNSDKPPFLRRRAPRLNPLRIQRMTLQHRDRQESLMAVDESVRDITRKLDKEGVLDNTYVVVTSDNGFFEGEHRISSGKMFPYDPSTRVPLVVRGPGIPTGRSTSELVSNEDLAATLLDAADAKAGKTVDGRSLLPYARRPRLRSERVLLHETGGLKPVTPVSETDTTPLNPFRRILTYNAVRTRRYLWVAYKGGSRELYDLKRDPAQLRSVHKAPAYAKTKRALHRELQRLRRCRGEKCRQDARPIPNPSRR